MRSLRTKIVLLMVCVMVATQIFTVTTILYNAKENSRDQAYTHLMTAVQTAGQFMEEHAASTKKISLSIADNGVLRKALASGNPAEIQTALELQREQINVDALLLADNAGVVRYTTSRNLPPDMRIAEEPLAGGELFTSVMGKTAYELLAVPVSISEQSAYLVTGTFIDNSYAEQITSVTGMQASFASDRATGNLFLGSSLDPLDKALMVAGIEEIRSRGAVYKALDEVNRRFVSTRTPFITKAGPVFLLMHQSLDLAMAPYKQLQEFMIHMVVTTIVLACLLVWIVSTIMTRPLHQLSEAVQRITVGDYTRKVDVKTRDEIGALAEVFNAMQDGIEHREHSILQQSLTDPITGLPNRQHALTLLNERIGNGYDVGVLLIDLGRFQHIRSTLGHRVSDEMLRLSTARMKRSIPDDAMLARLEGDEFLLVTPVSGIDAAMNEAETILSLLDSGLSIRKARISLDVHIGVSLYPDHGNSADDLLRRASLAKQDSIRARTPFKVYQDSKSEVQTRRLTILSDLRVAIDEHQLDLHMQPKFSLASGDVVGVEALVRWQHPELGAIMPDEFIPMLEESGSISQLTRWVLTEALHHCALWKHEGINIPVSVNLSVQDLKDETLPQEIDQMFIDHGLKAENLILEITEEALAQNLEAAISVLTSLRNRGIRISMDDFGTGYSSLYQLKHLPIDELKIDKEFIQDLPTDAVDVAIVRATVQLAATMGLDVVAEGVESEEAWHFLAREGCKEAQGYLVSRPMPAVNFVTWKHRYSRARSNSIHKGVSLCVDTTNEFVG